MFSKQAALIFLLSASMASSLDLNFDWLQRNRPNRPGQKGQGPSSGSNPSGLEGGRLNRPAGLGQGQSGNRPSGPQSGFTNRPGQSQGSSGSGCSGMQGDRPNRPAGQGQGQFDGHPSESLNGRPNYPGQSDGRPNSPDQEQPNENEDISEISDCNAKLVWVESGQSSTCSEYGENEDLGHYLPLLTSASDCYAWTGYGGGRTHENSAKNIRCSSDGMSVLYDQYAGNLNCSGSPVAKSYVLNECHQGFPSNLYDMGLDFSCCSDPDGEHCKNNLTGPPRNGRASALYINGEQCNNGRMLGQNDHRMTAGNLRGW